MEMVENVVLTLEQYFGSYVGFLRYAVPCLSAFLLLRCILPLLTFRREPEIWGWLNMEDGTQIPITHWENVIGRSKSCDVSIQFPTISRNHAVLTRYDDGSWTITDAGSKDGVRVNNRMVQISALKPRDRISLGGVQMQLQPISEKQEIRQAQLRTRASSGWTSVANLVLLTLLQCLMIFGYALGGKQEEYIHIVQGFGGIVLCQWLLYIFYAIIHRSSFEVETIASAEVSSSRARTSSRSETGRRARQRALAASEEARWASSSSTRSSSSFRRDLLYNSDMVFSYIKRVL